MKKLFCVLLVGMLLMSGCSEEEEKKTVCRYEMDGITEEMTLTSLGDTVLSTTSVLKLPFALYEVSTEEEKELFTEQMLSAFEVEGVHVESKSTEDEFILEMVINMEEVTLSTLAELGMIASDEVDSEVISLEKTLESLTTSGYTCE